MRNSTPSLQRALTPRQTRFVDEYMLDGNGARAAVAAGFSKRCAKELAYETLTYPHVRAALAARQAQDSQRLQIERDDVIAGLLEGIAMARDRCDGATMIRGWSEVGRMLGLFAPERRQVEVATAGGGELTAKISSMTDAELVAVIAGEKQILG